MAFKVSQLGSRADALGRGSPTLAFLHSYSHERISFTSHAWLLGNASRGRETSHWLSVFANYFPPPLTSDPATLHKMFTAVILLHWLPIAFKSCAMQSFSQEAPSLTTLTSVSQWDLLLRVSRLQPVCHLTARFMQQFLLYNQPQAAKNQSASATPILSLHTISRHFCTFFVSMS